MSFLTPLYIAGLLAVSLPVAFHLIRRSPQGERPFSSLMFLAASPPRITRRSRLEHLLLLALRGLALALLAAAFARPFWREPALANAAGERPRRIAVVVDTSASMRRGDLWQEAVRRVETAVAACRPQDELGVFACDETLRPIAGFEDLAQTEPGRRSAVVTARLRDLQPTWAATHLGQGLLDALARLDDMRDARADASPAARRIVLVSDMQSGSRLQTLGDFPWPTDVELELKRVDSPQPTNAGLERLADAEDEESGAARADETLRIRVTNAQDSTAEQFRLQWAGAKGETEGAVIDAFVPAGESRVVRAPAPPAKLDQPRLVLAGDAQDFDNLLFVVPHKREQVRVLYLGADAADDPQGLQYYLARALESDARRDVVIERLPLDDELDFDAKETPELTIVGADVSADQAGQLRTMISRGSAVVRVLTTAGGGGGLAALLDVDAVKMEEAKIDGYAMLGEIDFNHPLFVSMAGPRFNDFTQIRFWKYRRLELPDAADLHVVARFENGDPAIVEQRVGKGRLLVMTAGWQPADGQLARSWKFLLMLSSLIGGDKSSRLAGQYLVNQPVRLPPRDQWADNATITRPDGAAVEMASDARSFDGAAEPGIYSFSMFDGAAQFAVNLDPTESETTPMPPEVFEQLGCRLAGRADAAREAERLEQLRDVELESRQKLWQWLVVATLGVLVVETWLAGRLVQPAPLLGSST